MLKKTSIERGRPAYKIGKGRPPPQHQWKSGQSGNPRGRPKGSKNLDTILTGILNEKIRYTKNGAERTTTVREAILKRIGQKALNGDLKSADYLLTRDAEIARKNPPSLREKIDFESLPPKEREKRAQEAYFKLIRRVEG